MQIDKFTIAANDLEGMLKFYNQVFDAGLRPLEGTPLFQGSLAGLKLLFCPNSILGIEADKNRIQFRLVVTDIDAVIRKAQENGGGAYGDRMEDDSRIAWGLHDPDGNSIELLQLKHV